MYALRPAPGVLTRDLGAVVLVRVPSALGHDGDDFDLNETGAVVWRAISCGPTEPELYTDVVSGLDDDTEIRRFVDELIERRAVERVDIHSTSSAPGREP